MRLESHALFLLQESNGQKTSKLFVFVLNVALKKSFLENSHPDLFVLIKKRSV